MKVKKYRAKMRYMKNKLKYIKVPPPEETFASIAGVYTIVLSKCLNNKTYATVVHLLPGVVWGSVVRCIVV